MRNISDIYNYWWSGENKRYKLSDMDSGYIVNCLKNLIKWDKDWGDISFVELTTEELKRKDDVGMKAWFVIHGKNYMEAFSKELKKRNEL